MTPFQFDGLERNPDARCRNCPYWLSIDEVDGYCNQSAVVSAMLHKTRLSDFCGDHPNFWRLATDEIIKEDTLMTSAEILQRVEGKR